MRRLVFALLLALPLSADPPKMSVLENGATIVVKEDHNMPVVTLQAWFPIGSTTEGENLGQGLSHYVEHMIFKGTETQKPGDFARAVRAAGGDLNAYTHFERTVFHCTVRSEFFEPTLASLSDVIMNSTMDPYEAKKEQMVIVNELRMYLDDPNRMIQYAFNETAWRQHPCRHPIGGYLDQFLKLKPEDVGAYFRKWYAPNNMTFIVVGDVDADAAMAAAKKAFARFERKPLPPLVLPAEPEQRATRRETRTYPVRQGSSGARLKIGWHGVDALHPDACALDMAALVLGYGDSSRLSRVLKLEKKLVQTVYANNDTPSYRGSFAIGMQLEPSKLAEAEKEALAQVELLKTAEPAEAELERCLEAVMSYRVLGRQTVDQQADEIGQNMMYYGTPEYGDAYRAKLAAVTPADIRRVATEYFVPGRMTVAAVVPAAAKEDGATGAGAKPRPGFRPEIEEFTLDNGLRVVFRRNPNLPAFAITFAFLAGNRLEPADCPGLANLVSQMLLRGTTSLSAAQLAERINGTGGTMRVIGGRHALLLNAEMTVGHFDAALDLCADVLLNPAFDAAELDGVRQRVRFDLDNIARNTGQSTSARAMRALYPGHPYSRLPEGDLETVNRLTTEHLRAFYRRHVAADNGVVAVVGDLDRERVKAALEKRFGSLGRLAEKLPVIADPAPLEKGLRDETTDPSKNMGLVMVAFRTVDVRHEDRWPLAVLENVLGGMGGRLWDEVRDKRNLAYAVGASNAVMLQSGHFIASAQTQGQNTDPALDTMLEVLDGLATSLTGEEVVHAKNKAAGELIQSLQRLTNQAQGLALDTLYGLGPMATYDAPKKLEAVTLEDVRRVAKTYLARERMVLVMTRPAAK